MASLVFQKISQAFSKLKGNEVHDDQNHNSISSVEVETQEVIVDEEGTEKAVAEKVVDPETPPTMFEKGVGTVTVMENCLPKGTIDVKYYFTKSKFEVLIQNGLTRGTKVEYEAKKEHDAISWEVTSMKLHLSSEELEIENRRKYKTIVGQVYRFLDDNKLALVKYGKSHEEVQEIPYAALPQDYDVIRGDFLRIKLEALDMNDENDSVGKIISVEPSKRQTIVGKVTRNTQGQLSVENRIYFEQGVCATGRALNPHDIVRVVAVESKFHPRFNWRAVSVHISNFHSYTAREKPEEGWLEKENIWSSPLDYLMKDRNGITIDPKKVIHFGGVKLNQDTEQLIQIRNNSDSAIPLKSVHVQGDQYVCKFSPKFLNPKESDDIITALEPHSSYDLKICCSPVQLGGTRELCIFDFGEFKIGRHLVVTSLSDQDGILELISSPKRSQADNICKWQEVTSEEAISQNIQDKRKVTVRASAPFLRAPFFQTRNMEHNFVPKILWTIVQKADDDLLLEHFPKALKELQIETYKDKFELALWLEEIQNDVLRRQLDIKNTLLEKSGEYFKFEVPGIRDIHPPIQVGDPLTIHDHSESNKKYTTSVYDIRGTHIYIKFDNRDESCANNYVTVQFNLSRTTYKRCHHAIQQAEQYLGEKWLFPKEEVSVEAPRLPFFEDAEDTCEEDTNEENEERAERQDEDLADNAKKSTSLSQNNGFVAFHKSSKPAARPPSYGFGNSRKVLKDHRLKNNFGDFVSDTKGPVLSDAIRLKWINSSLNKEQKDAVRRIIRGQARPLPYIIFGPPGTGKTVTVVEAVIQIYKLDPNSRTLVVAPSNSAADVITEHLVRSNQFLPGDFVRLVGFLRQEIQIPESIRDYCVDGDNLETVARHRLIVSTCTTAGQFVTLGLDTSGHFTHVFIDEAGYCTEPEAIIPATLCALSKEGQVILAGDPKQLGPVLMSDVAANCGLSLSLLERLMSLPLYSRNVDKFPEEKYNPIVLTKLVKNYRAHPTLLNLPSRLFYDDELEAAADKEETDLSHSLDFLGNSRGVPLLFHGVQGRSEREVDSPSWYNKAEIIQVLNYVRELRNVGLSNNDIGIITPYRKQVEKIRRALELGLLLDEVPKVGSVEEFQGGERKAMIMSLVRSVPETMTDNIIDRMSFVFSPKRFNVAITRAKALLIVIGNPHIMAHDRNWHTFLKYCLDLNCYVGCNLPLHLDQLTQDYLENLSTNEEGDDSTEDQTKRQTFFGASNNNNSLMPVTPAANIGQENDWI